MGTKKKMSLGLEWQDRGILSEKDQSKNGPRTNTKSKKQIQKTKTKPIPMSKITRIKIARTV